MFAVGLSLFVVSFFVALWCGAAKIDTPEWLELLGGTCLLGGVVLMLASALWHYIPHLWRVMP